VSTQRITALFTKLHRFSLKLHNTNGGLPLLSCALEITSILGLRISSFVDNNLSRHHLQHFIPPWDLEYTTTSLSMLRCQLDSELLRTFLYRFHSLRRFEYLHLKDFYSTSNRRLCMVPEMVRKDLILQKFLLKNSTSCTKLGPWPDFDALEDPIQSIGFLAEFEKLSIKPCHRCRAFDRRTRPLFGQHKSK
jgi:hypothetical protein